MLLRLIHLDKAGIHAVGAFVDRDKGNCIASCAGGLAELRYCSRIAARACLVVQLRVVPRGISELPLGVHERGPLQVRGTVLKRSSRAGGKKRGKKLRKKAFRLSLEPCTLSLSL